MALAKTGIRYREVCRTASAVPVKGVQRGGAGGGLRRAVRAGALGGSHHQVVRPAGPREKVAPLFLVPPIPPHNASPFCLCSPHPVKPLSAAPVEGSPDRKQSRSSLSTALSSGLEKLKTVTSGSIQPVAPAPQVGQTVDAKRLKVRPSRVPGASEQTFGAVKRCQVSRGQGPGAGQGGARSRPGPPHQSLEAS